MRKFIILFDGVCNLCNASVNFIIDRDPKARFQFVSLQSRAGREISSKHGICSGDLSSVVLIKDSMCYRKSAAVLRIATGLGGAWALVWVFYFIPSFVRDFLYDIVAKNRYLWFGRRETCRVLTPELKDRFLQ